MLDQQFGSGIIKLLGNSRIQVKCLINKNGKQIYQDKIGVIRGSMRKRQWINIGDILILSERDFEKDGKMDIIYVYSKEDKYKIIQTENLKFNNDANNDEDIVEFIDEDNYEIEEQREYTETPWFLSNNNSSRDEDIIDSNNKKSKPKSNKINISNEENISKKNKFDDDEIDLI